VKCKSLLSGHFGDARAQLDILEIQVIYFPTSPNPSNSTDPLPFDKEGQGNTLGLRRSPLKEEISAIQIIE